MSNWFSEMGSSVSSWFDDVDPTSAANGFWSALSCGSKAGRGTTTMPNCEESPPSPAPAWEPGTAWARGQKELRNHRPTAQKGIQDAFAPWLD
jgi:hypothetical protein